MSFWKRLSLKVKIMVMACGIVFAYGLGNHFQTTKIFDLIEFDKLEKFEVSARALGSALASQFFERYGDVQAFAFNPDIQSLKPENMVDDIDKYVGLYGIYDLILVIDKDGNYVASNTKDVTGQPVDHAALKKVNYANTVWFKAVMEGKTTDEPSKKIVGTYFEDFQVDPIQKLAFNDNRWSTSFSSAIRNTNGDIIGVITNRANSSWVENEFKHAYDAMKDMDLGNAEVKLVNGAGKFVVQHYPAGNGGKNEIIHNFDTLGKMDLAEEHPDVAERVKKENVGTGYSFDKELDDYQAVGFVAIRESKMPTAINWRVIVMNSKEETIQAVTTAQINFYIFAGIMALLAGVFAWWFSRTIAKQLNLVTEVLSKNSDEVASASTLIAEQATKVSEASTEQAAAIQETMAAVDQISAMVDKNADSAEKSKSVSQQSQAATERGKQTVQNMVEAINQISQANESIAQQMEANNKQISDVVRLITDIGQKTKVINDIVFQTKLLSFNASVEAARAGEYGKGFAVVAEEVGNLAQMSGNAAKEITTMLDESIRQAEGIVKDTQSRVDKLVADSRSKVSVGIETSALCNEALTEIAANVNSVDALVSEISIASKEQASGVREISTAVGQLDVATQENASVAQRSSHESDKLNEQSVMLRDVIKDLAQIVQGENSASMQDEYRPTKKVEQKAKPKLELVKRTTSAKVGKKSTNTYPPKKMAAGSDVVPSSADSRFEEV